MSLIDIGKDALKAAPKEWRPAMVMGFLAAAMVFGYFHYIAGPISEAHAQGIDNTTAISHLDQKSDERSKLVQQRLRAIEGSQAEQGQQLKDMSGQMSIILQVLLTGQRPAPQPRKHK